MPVTVPYFNEQLKKHSSMSPKLSPFFFFLLFLKPTLCQTALSRAPITLLCFSGSLVTLIMLHCPQNKVLTLWPGICALYNLTAPCCFPNCSMFQANCAPRRCPSPVCALFPLGLHGMLSLPLHLSQF